MCIRVIIIIIIIIIIIYPQVRVASDYNYLQVNG